MCGTFSNPTLKSSVIKKPELWMPERSGTQGKRRYIVLAVITAAAVQANCILSL
jgi:hypothetical protein